MINWIINIINYQSNEQPLQLKAVIFFVYSMFIVFSFLRLNSSSLAFFIFKQSIFLTASSALQLSYITVYWLLVLHTNDISSQSNYLFPAIKSTMCDCAPDYISYVFWRMDGFRPVSNVFLSIKAVWTYYLHKFYSFNCFCWT